MTQFFKHHPNLALWLFFTGLATFVLFFISPDSYFNDLHTRCDSAWFFMCGKAWMNGLTPYVDFADSKGPLLWLIYGLGYLLSHTNYLGVFWISCFWYGLTYFFTYKTADIFLKDTRKSVACTVLMTLAFFNPWFHNEIRAEDFCLLFLTLSLYSICILLYTNPDEKKSLISFAVLGACFTALFLIKFNITLMQAIFIILALVYLIHEKKNGVKPLLSLFGGILIVWLPFFICFLFAGNLSAFFQEYIINTLHTVSSTHTNGTNILVARIHTDNPLVAYLLEWGGLAYRPDATTLLIFLILGGILFIHSKHPYRWMPLLASLWIFAVAIRHHFMHYFCSCAPLLVFLLISLFLLFDKPLSKSFVPVCVIVTLGLLIPMHILSYNYKILFFNHNANQRDFYRISSLLSQVEHPRMISAYDFEYGYGVLAEALPAGKYWCCQVGMTDEMMQEHQALILSGKADFIFVNLRSFEQPGFLSKQQILDTGYHECFRFGEENDYLLLSNHDDLILTDEVTRSLKDLFFKRIISWN